MTDTYTMTGRRSGHTQDLWQFVAISHDLMGPVRVIRQCADLLHNKARATDQETNRLLSCVSKTAERMQTLIDDALVYALASEPGTNLSAVDADVVLKFAASNLEKAISETGAAITSDQLPVVNANFGALARVFENLLANALKYRAESRPRVHIGCAQRGGEWSFSVADNGIGIAPEYHEQVFLPLKRLHPQDQYPGNGLGLAICRRIVESCGGRMWVQSALGKGSVFYFTIPHNHEAYAPEESELVGSMSGADRD